MLHTRIAKHVVNHVIPTKENGFVPHLLKAPAMWAVMGVGIALFGFSHLLHTTNYLNISAEVYPATVVTLTNEDRVASGLAPLAVSPALEAAARLKAQDMVTNNYFAHTSPSGVTPWHWFEQAGYTFIYAGENLAVNFTESGEVATAWLNSPTHRANVMSPKFTEIGIAIAQGNYKGNYTTYVVELFGMPAMTSLNARPVVSTKPAATPSTTKTVMVTEPLNPTIAGASTQSTDAALLTTDESEEFISVQNTDPTLVQASTSQAAAPKVSWWSKVILNMDKYIGVIVEVIIIALIMALATLALREREKHHRMHMIYGVLMVIILTSALFVGRIGVFAEATSPVVLPYLEY